MLPKDEGFLISGARNQVREGAIGGVKFPGFLVCRSAGLLRKIRVGCQFIRAERVSWVRLTTLWGFAGFW